MNPHGSKWIRPEKRARIYERDSWRCVWCQKVLWDVPAGYRTLDHVITRKGGNHAHNLVTCCLSCNSARQHMTAKEFAHVIARRIYLSGKRSSAGGAMIVLNRVLKAVFTDLPAQLTLVTPEIQGDAE